MKNPIRDIDLHNNSTARGRHYTACFRRIARVKTYQLTRASHFRLQRTLATQPQSRFATYEDGWTWTR